MNDNFLEIQISLVDWGATSIWDGIIGIPLKEETSWYFVILVQESLD